MRASVEIGEVFAVQAPPAYFGGIPHRSGRNNLLEGKCSKKFIRIEKYSQFHSPRSDWAACRALLSPGGYDKTSSLEAFKNK
jgi:hypothetical protein